MSETSNDIQSSEDAEFDVELEVENSEEAPKRGKPVAWIALIVSILALAASAFTLVSDWMAADDPRIADNSASIAQLDQRLEQSAEAVSELDTRLGQIRHPDFGPEIEALERDIEDRLQRLSSLPPRMTNLEDSVASLAGISAGARETFLLAEAEYYLQIANAQLQLANNPHLASLALAMADERVTVLSDPRLIEVRRAIANERAALEVMTKPDIEGATLTLGSLARVVESLPFASETPPEEAEAAYDPEQSGARRAWETVKAAMLGLVKVTPPDAAEIAIVSPEAKSLVRSNLALQLQSARLALLRGEQAIFEQALDDTSAILNNYFDTSSPQVESAEQTIAEIRGSVFTLDIPDISESLRLLRQYRTLSESAE